MQNSILLSLIVPVFNAEQTLSRCLDSIVVQPFKDFEVVVVNDASTDSSQSIIDNYVARYPGIVRSFTKVNGGPGDTRNYGIKQAAGKFLTFVDSDDYITADYYAVVKSMIETHDPDMIMIGYQRKYQRPQQLLERFHRFSSWEIYDRPITLRSHPDMIYRTEGAPWLRVLRKEIFFNHEQLYFSNCRIAEDQEAALKWMLHARKIVFCKQQLYNYVIQPDSLNAKTDSILDFTRIIDSVCDYYKIFGKWQQYQSELEIVFIKQMLISNMRRLRAAAGPETHKVFMTLRATLLNHFPAFFRNKYLKKEPIYIRMATYLAWRWPWVFKYIL